MERIADILLRLGLIAAAFGSLLSLTRMILATFLPIQWYFWGAVAFFVATLSFSAAIYLRGALRPPALGTPKPDSGTS